MPRMQWTALVCACALSVPLAAQAPRKSAPAKSAKPAAPQTSRQVAQAWLEQLTLRERVAQLVMIPFYGDAPNSRSKAWRDFVHLVRDVRVGGFILVNRAQNGIIRNAEPYEMAAFMNRMQRLSRLPLILAGDFERGASMRVAETTKFPHLMAFGAAGDLAATRALGAATARESRALGVQWVFVPDADVNNNPDNPIINIRSFGENPQAVAEHVKAFIEGLHSGPGPRVLGTIKHFPGHGDTAVDSHIGLARNEAKRERLEAVEFVPFRAGIAAGIDAVMSAHMAVPALEPEEMPATVSKNVLTKLLREELGFRGIAVTDAMDMQGLAKLYSPAEAAVRSLEAGADLLLMPPKPEEAVKGVLDAIQKKRLTRKRIDESVLRLLTAKVETGLGRKRLVNLEGIADALESPEAEELAQSVAERAATALRNENATLPLAAPQNACYFALFESRYSITGRKLVEELRRRAPRATTFIFDPNVPEATQEEALKSASACPAIVVTTFVTASAYRGGVGLSGNYPALMEKLLKSGKPVVMVSLGNPYLLRNYPSVAAYVTTFSNAPTSELAAVKALFGEIAIEGKTPVSIPGIAKIGDGLKIAKRAN